MQLFVFWINNFRVPQIFHIIKNIPWLQKKLRTAILDVYRRWFLCQKTVPKVDNVCYLNFASICIEFLSLDRVNVCFLLYSNKHTLEFYERIFPCFSVFKKQGEVEGCLINRRLRYWIAWMSSNALSLLNYWLKNNKC